MIDRRRSVRVALSVVAAVATAAAAFGATVLLAFGLTPTCETTGPPGPPRLDVALAVTALVAGAIPVQLAGRSLGGWRWAFGALAAAPPLVALVLTMTRSSTGFCF